MQVTNRFKELDLIDRVPEELWMKVCDIVYNAGFGGVRNDSVNITIMDEVAQICGEEGNSFSLNRGDPHYRNRIALDAYELAKPKIKEQLRKKLPKYSVKIKF